MKRSLLTAAFATSIAISIMHVAAAASIGHFEVEGSEESRVQFVSEAPLEKISGVGHTVTGQLDFDPSAISKTKGTIELDVASIRTNVDLRDEHLRSEAWLDAKKYPKILFKITKVEGPDKLMMKQSVDLIIKGKVSMHGVTRDETATAQVRWVSDKAIRVKASFKVNLADYKISVPAVVRLKVANQIALNVILAVRPKL